MNKPYVSVPNSASRLTLAEINQIRQQMLFQTNVEIDPSLEESLRKELILQTAWYMQKEIERIGIDTYITLIKKYDLQICSVLSNHSLRMDLLDEECPYDGSDYHPRGENLILCGLEYLAETGVITNQHLAKIKMYAKEI